MEQGTSRRKVNHHGNKRFWVILAVIAVVLLGIGTWVWGRHGPLTPFDSNAVDSSRKPLTEGEMLRELQRQADESSFRFKINSEVTVTSDDSGDSSSTESHQKADWNIVNSIENTCNMVVTITETDGTVLYESQTLKPGAQDFTGALLSPLAPGTYTAEATAKAIDPETGDVLGNVTAEIRVTVEG